MTKEQENLIQDFQGLFNVLKSALKGQRKWLAIATLDIAIQKLTELRKQLKTTADEQ